MRKLILFILLITTLNCFCQIQSQRIRCVHDHSVGISIYPNPVLDNNIHIGIYSSKLIPIINIYLYDLKGNLILKYRLTSISNIPLETIYNRDDMYGYFNDFLLKCIDIKSSQYFLIIDEFKCTKQVIIN